jgi:hypothetical protein
MKMISKRTLENASAILVLVGVASSSLAQTTSVCPTEVLIPNNSAPRVIFPMTPLAGEAWQACYQNPTACAGAPAGNAQTHLEITTSPNSIELKTQWLYVAFSPCPGTGYRTASMPAVAQAGPITIRMVQRTADSVSSLSFFPFVQTFEQVIEVRAPVISSFAVPALDWRASLALCGLLIGVAASRRR